MTPRLIAISAAALVSMLATPVLAASHKHPAKPAMSMDTAVVAGGDRMVGADPDANIRSELLREAYVSEY